MKGTIGNLLLVTGTALSGIGGANAQRASRAMALDEVPASGEVLFGDVTDDSGELLLAAGGELDVSSIEELKAAGVETVLVRVPPRDTESVSATDPEATVGRSLSEALTVSEDVTIPAGKFIDEKVAAQIAGSGVERVDVNVVREFSFDDWDGKALFLAGILAMVAGITVKRTARIEVADEADGSGASGPAQMRQRLEDMSRAVADLAARAETMDAEAIHGELTPLFSEYGQPFVDDRHVLTAAWGAGRYAAILGPFSSAERRLNRAWSAAVDGALEEARLQLAAAVPYLEESLAAFPR